MSYFMYYKHLANNVPRMQNTQSFVRYNNITEYSCSKIHSIIPDSTKQDPGRDGISDNLLWPTTSLCFRKRIRQVGKVSQEASKVLILKK